MYWRPKPNCARASLNHTVIINISTNGHAFDSMGHFRVSLKGSSGGPFVILHGKYIMGGLCIVHVATRATVYLRFEVRQLRNRFERKRASINRLTTINVIIVELYIYHDHFGPITVADRIVQRMSMPHLWMGIIFVSLEIHFVNHFSGQPIAIKLSLKIKSLISINTLVIVRFVLRMLFVCTLGLISRCVFPLGFSFVQFYITWHFSLAPPPALFSPPSVAVEPAAADPLAPAAAAAAAAAMSFFLGFVFLFFLPSSCSETSRVFSIFSNSCG